MEKKKKMKKKKKVAMLFIDPRVGKYEIYWYFVNTRRELIVFLLLFYTFYI